MTRNGPLAAQSVRSCFRNEKRNLAQELERRPCGPRGWKPRIDPSLSLKRATGYDSRNSQQSYFRTLNLELDNALRQLLDRFDARYTGGPIPHWRHDAHTRLFGRLGDQHRLHGDPLEGRLGSSR